MYRVWSFVLDLAVLVVLGALAGLVWSLMDPAGYRAIGDTVLWQGAGLRAGDAVTPRWIVAHLLMAGLYAFAAKEIWEAVILQRGSLQGARAVVPLAAALGGLGGAFAAFLLGAAFFGLGPIGGLGGLWAMPLASDFALAFVLAGLIFGRRHPMVRFVLVVAILDDLASLLLVTLFVPMGDFVPGWLALSGAAGLGAFVLFNWLPRRLDRGRQSRPWSTLVRTRLSWMPYALAGALSWYGFYRAGLNPALGLLPVIPAMPHADRAFGVFAAAERALSDVLNRAQTRARRPMEAAVFVFALLHAGLLWDMAPGAPVPLAPFAFAVAVGKPAGVILALLVVARLPGVPQPRGLGPRSAVVASALLGMTFTTGLVIAAGLPAGVDTGTGRMALWASLGMGLAALGLATVLRRRRSASLE